MKTKIKEFIRMTYYVITAYIFLGSIFFVKMVIDELEPVMYATFVVTGIMLFAPGIISEQYEKHKCRKLGIPYNPYVDK